MIRSRQQFYTCLSLVGLLLVAVMAKPHGATGQTLPLERKLQILFVTDRLKTNDSEFFSERRAPDVTFGTAIAASKANTRIGRPPIIRIENVELSDDAKVLRVAEERRSILIYVHGYATTFRSALETAATIADSIPYDGQVLVYAWPSRGSKMEYLYDKESADRSTAFLARLVERLMGLAGVVEVSVIAHSLGNRPLIDALWDLRRQIAEKERGKLGHIILCSPDVDKDYFEQRAAAIALLARSVTLFASGQDRALEASRRVNGGVPRAGDVPPEGPIIVNGIDTIDATRAGNPLNIRDFNHNAYAQVDDLIKDVGLILASKHRRRPSTRSKRIYKERQIAAGIYWVYQP